MTSLARNAALTALHRWRRGGSFLANVSALAQRELDERDSALAHRLVMTVAQHRVFLDGVIDHVKSGNDLEPRLRDILRIGAAQLFFFERVPKSAAVNEAVKQAKERCPKAAGFVNALMRRLSQIDREEALDMLGGEARLRYGFPEWLSDELAKYLGEDEIAAFAEAVNTPPYVTLVNKALEVTRYSGVVRKLNSFRSGECIVADEGALRIVKALGTKPGQSLWDTCAAPGGKSFMAAFIMKNCGFILSTDISKKRMANLCVNARRLCVNIIEAVNADAAVYQTGRLFDAVLCDVPCSGLGALAKKPDIRHKDPASFALLPDTQLAIALNASKAVRTGGRLVYSTCTFRKEENEDVVNKFLCASPNFALEDEVTLWPHIDGTDGFYYAVLRRL
jgi:16S rRNA (cytosine967-C5)-methyltransferase